MIYLDNAATTKVCSAAKQAMEPFFQQYYGNPSGIYNFSKDTRVKLEEARQVIAGTINASPENIIFTSGGTEGDNWILDNAAYKGTKIITSNIEHHAILNKCEKLEREGIEVVYLPVDNNGRVIIDELKKAISVHATSKAMNVSGENSRTISLVSIMYANNEIGTIEPIKDIVDIAHKKGIEVHTDAVQAYGHMPIDVKRLGIDYLSASSHKFGGPKGVGFVYVKNPNAIIPLIWGGGQERGKRSGTENVAGIIGMAAAAVDAHEHMNKNLMKEKALRDYLINRLLAEIPQIQLNGDPKNRLPGNANFSIAGIDGISLVVMLDMDGICISAASACSAKSDEPSHVIRAIGMSDDMAYGTIRITLNHENTRKEIDYTIEKIKENIKKLRQNR